MQEKRRKWSREETIIAFYYYCQIPFAKIVDKHPLVQECASLIGRKPSAVKMKLGNFGRLDPALKAQGISGLKNGAKLELEIWNAFQENWEEMMAQTDELLSQQTVVTRPLQQDLSSEFGEDVWGRQKQRRKQGIFRKMVLSNYNYRCCLTGLSQLELLVASHIVPWARAKKERLNPQNGLCLNSLHDKAFDRGLISFDENYCLLLSEELEREQGSLWAKQFFLPYKEKRLILPNRFLPNPDFLAIHRRDIFKG
ncbi:HNH endonuclease [Saprospira grandis]|uniref:HNH endonuclease n=1 Tax=Saprospira grandis TaxID=1008 RepID=UPI0022DD56EE|nr:HNH endonuclease [Saprospira grandis]WBM73273.1 HNH endonuclease [Saprospira grandis]